MAQGSNTPGTGIRKMGEILVLWVVFATMVFVAVLAHFVIVRSALESGRERAVPRGWLREVDRRDWSSGQEEGVAVSMPPRLPPRVPPEAHVRS